MDGQPVLYGYLIQLRHVRSGLFVALRERVLAHLEPDCLRVELGRRQQLLAERAARLVGLPGRGRVREGDRVLLLSAKTRQHCTAPPTRCPTSSRASALSSRLCSTVNVPNPAAEHAFT